MSTSLLDIPEEVFPECVFDFLTQNELLRLRRSCTWTKKLTEDYLRRHPRPHNRIFVDLDNRESPDYLYNFLHADLTNSTIRRPFSRLKLECRSSASFQNPLLEQFLSHYGKQVTHLQVSSMSLPMGDEEFKFYTKFTKLKSLNVYLLVEEETAETDCPFPETLRRISSLTLCDWKTLSKIPTNFLWSMLQFCGDLKYLRYPEDKPPIISQLLGLLEDNKLKKFETYDMIYQFGHGFQHYFANLTEICVKFNVKLINMDARILHARCSANYLEKLAPQIVSLQGFKGKNDDFRGTTFPNVEEIKLEWYPLFPIPPCARDEWFNLEIHFPPIDALRRTLNPSIYPGLKRLEIQIELGPLAQETIALIWPELPNLEEVVFRECRDAGDMTFIGPNPEKPTFLELTNLRKLELRGVEEMKNLTDVVFQQVLCNMRLRELKLKSRYPITSFTSSGISSLLAGAFATTIEKFSFKSWSLAHLNKAAFLQLSRQFPNNQPL